MKNIQPTLLCIALALASAPALASPGPPAQCGKAHLKLFNRYQVCVVASLVRALKDPEFDSEAANQGCAEKLGEGLDKAFEKFGSECAIDDHLEAIAITGYMNEQAAAFVEYFVTGSGAGFPPVPPALTEAP